MTWAEFMIRSFAWRRKEKRGLYKLRELAWITYIAPHQDPKKLKKSKEAFWQIEEKKKGVTESQKKAIEKAQKIYFEELNLQQNG